MRDRLRRIRRLRDELRLAPILSRPAIAEQLMAELDELLVMIVDELEQQKGVRQ